MDDGTETNAWQETGAVVRPAAWARPSTQPTDSSHVVNYQSLTDIEPATDREFITILTPCLQLVAPVGMSLDAQDMWFEAARMALAQFPASLLKRGAQHAMMNADHPSKIVPLIVKEIAPALEQRKRLARGRDDKPHTALPAPGQEYCTPDELAAICKQFKVGRYSPHDAAVDPHAPTTVPTTADPARPCKVPTRADYIRMGVDPSALEGMA